MNQKKYIYAIGVILLAAVVVTIGLSYAYFTASVGGSGNQNVNTTNVTAVSLGSIKYEGQLTFQGQGLYPGYKNIQTFTIEKDSQSGIGIYEIDLEATIPEAFGRDIEIKLYKTTNPTNNNITRTEGTLVQSNNQYKKEDMITINGTPELIYEGVFIKSSQIILEQQDFNTNTLSKTTYYLVYNYKDNDNQDKQQGQTFTGKVSVQLINTKNYSEAILNGTDPVITGSLIPINLANDGTVTKADVSKEWYSYTNKEWANAIILKDENISYNNGDNIPESNIESYFVWIPRYRYKIFDSGDYPTRGSIDNTKVQMIEVEFETKDTPASTGSAEGAWLTHPAFTAFNTNGMWVGKYETSKSTGSDNERNGEAVQIKPNVSSWRSIQVANAFYSSYDYKRDLESHMMKNTEWGAVAYLQHSLYGSQQSVRINNNSAYVTGYAANNEPTCGYTATNEECNVYCSNGSCNQPYNTETGYLASTTANITGIYDMSGGAWEYVMGVMTDQNGIPLSGRNNMYNSGFNGPLGCPTCDSDTSGITNITNGLPWPESKYYDTYAYSTGDQQYNRRILGDATGEMGPFGTATYTASNGTSQSRSIGSWYAAYAYFGTTYSPWFRRGTNSMYGSDAGVFAFSGTYGHANSGYSFRVVLTP